MELKVIHVFRTYLPFTENWLFNLISNAKNIKHLIYAEKLDPGIFNNPDFDYYGFSEDLNPNRYKTVTRIFLEKLFHFFFPFNTSKSAHFLKKVLQKENPSVIHVHFAMVALPYMKLFQSLNLPLVISFYGYDYNPKYHYKFLFLRATKILCEGEAGKAQLVLMGCPPNKIEIVPLGIVPSGNMIIKNKKQDHLRLLQIASFNEKKGYIYTIKAFENALPKCPGMTLALIGPDSKIKSEIEQYISDKNLKPYVTILNAISPEELEETFQNFDVFIHPSVVAGDGDNEGGAPVVLLNAQINGLPVISTFHKDIPSYVLHQKTGLLATEKNIEALEQHIIAFYKMDLEKYILYSKNAQDHVLNNYNIVNNAQKLSFIYNAILKE